MALRRRLRRMFPNVPTRLLLQVRLIMWIQREGGGVVDGHFSTGCCCVEYDDGRACVLVYGILTRTNSCCGCKDQGPARRAQGHPTRRRASHPLRLGSFRRRRQWPSWRHHQRRDVYCRRRLHQGHRSQRPAQPIHPDQRVHPENGKYFAWSIPADTKQPVYFHYPL